MRGFVIRSANPYIEQRKRPARFCTSLLLLLFAAITSVVDFGSRGALRCYDVFNVWAIIRFQGAQLLSVGKTAPDAAFVSVTTAVHRPDVGSGCGYESRSS